MLVAPTQNVVKQPDSQGAGSRPHFFDAECFKNGGENGDAPGDHFPAIIFEPRNLDAADVAEFDQHFPQVL